MDDTFDANIQIDATDETTVYLPMPHNSLCVPPAPGLNLAVNHKAEGGGAVNDYYVYWAVTQPFRNCDRGDVLSAPPRRTTPVTQAATQHELLRIDGPVASPIK